jgi:muramoyltetrapeptide carboxypeptidase LdcA involved in peptidoglycan recycling
MEKGLEYTIEYFKKCLMSDECIDVVESQEWSDDAWLQNQQDREFIKNSGYVVINQGCGEGTAVGGNLSTFTLLEGTDYMPSLNNSILLIEDDNLIEDYFSYEFDRNLQSLIQQRDFRFVKGILIGRFQKACNINLDVLKKIISSKKELNGIPVIYGVDFGHTTPNMTLPIGGTIKICASEDEINISIIKH